jgi:hypothetical protein
LSSGLVEICAGKDVEHLESFCTVEVSLRDFAAPDDANSYLISK